MSNCCHLSSSLTTPDGSSSALQLRFLPNCAALEIAIVLLDKMVKIATAFFTVEGSILLLINKRPTAIEVRKLLRYCWTLSTRVNRRHIYHRRLGLLYVLVTNPVGGQMRNLCLCAEDEKMARCTKGLSDYESFINLMDDPNFAVLRQHQYHVLLIFFRALFHARKSLRSYLAFASFMVKFNSYSVKLRSMAGSLSSHSLSIAACLKSFER